MKCPHCQKDCEITPMTALKIHIRHQIYSNKRIAERHQRLHGTDDHRAGVIAKWQSWLNAIESLEAKAQ